jgi:hypothetical protein
LIQTIVAIANRIRFTDPATRKRTEKRAMNSFDVIVFIGLAIAVFSGFNASLLRSAVTILAHLIAMPTAVWAMSLVFPDMHFEDSGSLITPARVR